MQSSKFKKHTFNRRLRRQVSRAPVSWRNPHKVLDNREGNRLLAAAHRTVPTPKPLLPHTSASILRHMPWGPAQRDGEESRASASRDGNSTPLQPPSQAPQLGSARLSSAQPCRTVLAPKLLFLIEPAHILTGNQPQRASQCLWSCPPASLPPLLLPR